MGNLLSVACNNKLISPFHLLSPTICDIILHLLWAFMKKYQVMKPKTLSQGRKILTCFDQNIHGQQQLGLVLEIRTCYPKISTIKHFQGQSSLTTKNTNFNLYIL